MENQICGYLQKLALFLSFFHSSSFRFPLLSATVSSPLALELHKSTPRFDHSASLPTLTHAVTSGCFQLGANISHGPIFSLFDCDVCGVQALKITNNWILRTCRPENKVETRAEVEEQGCGREGLNVEWKPSTKPINCINLNRKSAMAAVFGSRGITKKPQLIFSR